MFLRASQARLSSAFALSPHLALLLAREAGVSIKPGVERGFASATPGSRNKNMSEPVKRATALNAMNAVAHFMGSRAFQYSILGFRSQSLAPPQVLCSRLLRRLRRSARFAG